MSRDFQPGTDATAATERAAQAGLVAERWSPPTVFGRTFDSRGRPDLRADKQQRATLDAVFAKAQAEGFAAGQAQFNARNAQLQERIERFDAVLKILARPLNE